MAWKRTKINLGLGDRPAGFCPQCGARKCFRRRDIATIHRLTRIDEFVICCENFWEGGCTWSIDVPEEMRLLALGAVGLFDD